MRGTSEGAPRQEGAAAVPTATGHPSHDGTDARHNQALRRDWANFTALTFLFMFGFAVYNGVFQNFLRETLHATPLDLGRLESLREVPGLLAALMAGVVASLAEARVAGLGLLITGIGMGLTGHMPGYWSLVGISVLWSVGFHLYTGVAPAITLALAKGEEGGRHLGRMTAVGSVATITGLGFALALAKMAPNLGYAFYFHLSGACILAAAYLCARLSTHAAGAPRARLILRKEYGLYYLLVFLEGCRRQIFSIFASFTLIAVYGVPLKQMLALQFINAIMIAVTAPRMGRAVDRLGQRGPLLVYAVGLIAVFVGYATIPNRWVLAGLFLLDNVLFTFGVAFTTYLHRIVRPAELTPCLAMGLTMNHVAAVTIPILGAMLWVRTDNYQLPFWGGVVIAFLSLLATLRLPTGPSPARPSSG